MAVVATRRPEIPEALSRALLTQNDRISKPKPRSLYSTVMYGRGITNDSYFIERALSNVREFTEADGQEFVYRRFIAPASTSVRFAKALDRSVTGSMNDMIRHATYWLAQGNLSPFDIGFRLNDIPMSALARNGSPYCIPRDAFKTLVALRSDHALREDQS
jgi:hypothetical protein